MNSKYLVNGLFILCYSMFLMFMSACYNELETVDFEEHPITWIRYLRCGRVEVRLSYSR